MKPPPFEYEAPRELDGALALLTEHGSEGKVLAGGQSLVPLLNFRLARPELLIDVNEVQDLSYLLRKDGRLRIGALTRHMQAERSALVAERWPILVAALHYVGHPQIRSRGTVGGSCVHADPTAELPVVLTALDARFHVRSERGERTLTHEEMFRGQLESGLEEDELLCQVEVPPVSEGAGWAFVEYARRHGDFALGGAAVIVETEDGGVCKRVALALLGGGATPVRPTEVERELVGRRLSDETARAAAADASRDLAPTGDIHGSSGYRRDLIETLTARALLSAAARAEGTVA